MGEALGGEHFNVDAVPPVLVGELFDFEGRDDVHLFFVTAETVGPDALAAVRRLRAASRAAVVVLLCQKTNEEDEVLALEAGADDCIPVSFDLRRIWPRLRARVGRVRRAPQAPRRMRAIELDQRTHQAIVDGRPVRLSPLEFRLLSELRRERGALVRHDRLETLLWGEANASSRQCLTQLVRRLRHRLGESGSAVASVPGVGYMLK